MNISSTPFIRNDYWPDYNDIDILNKRIDEAENETSLVNSRLTNDIENVSNNLNSYKNAMADTVITNNIIVNNLNANYAIGKYANFANTNTDNAYIENLTVNKPVFDITLNTPHVENITSIGGNFYDANLFNVAVENITSIGGNFYNTNLFNVVVENITSIGGNFYGANLFNAAVENMHGTLHNSNIIDSTMTNITVDNLSGAIVNATISDSTLVNAMLDGNGVLGNVEINNTVINTANVKELFVNTQPEPVTSSAVLGYDGEGRVIPIKASFEVGFPENANYLYTDQHGTAFPGTAETEVNASDNLITSYAVYNALANVNNTANNLLDNVDYLKNIVESSLLPANITGWNSSTYPVIIQGITEFAVEPLSADYYPISPELDRIRFKGSYYEKNGNNYVKQDVTTYNTYDDSVHVSWDASNKYKAKNKIIKDPVTGERVTITIWQTSSNQLATSGYYLSVDEQLDTNTYIVKLLSLTFDKGILPEGAASGTLYKLSSDFNFQDNVSYYVKNGNNFEGLKVNQGQCTFTTDPITDNNFYIYQKGTDWSYPNTTGPEYSILAINNVYTTIYTASSFPLYTEIETMTAYVGDKAKLSVSGTKATLALPGLYWTKANMDMAFYNCSSFNQKMIIQNSVTSMVSTFEGCSSFNQPDMLIYSQNITNMTNAFKGCHINNVHILTSVPKDTSNFIYNCLVNGNTGITFSAANIFNDLN